MQERWGHGMSLTGLYVRVSHTRILSVPPETNVVPSNAMWCAGVVFPASTCFVSPVPPSHIQMFPSQFAEQTVSIVGDVAREYTPLCGLPKQDNRRDATRDQMDKLGLNAL